MAHDAQRVFFERVRQAEPRAFKGGRILEVGSLNINGTVRDFFESPEEYIGVDIGHGPGVDLVMSGHEVSFPDGYFDVTVSAECFEHNPYWAETFVNMVRMTKRSGFIMFTCAGEGRPEHGTTRSDIGSSPLTVAAGWDYYRNLMDTDFEPYMYTLEDGGWQFYYEPYAKDLYFVGRKDDSFRVLNTEGTWMEPLG